jgi:hypothetical protein
VERACFHATSAVSITDVFSSTTQVYGLGGNLLAFLVSLICPVMLGISRSMNQAPLTLEAPPIATSTLNRRLVAIAFADVASFSRLMALSEVETVRRWKALRTQIMEPHMLRHGGRLVDLAGDGMLVEFSSCC